MKRHTRAYFQFLVAVTLLFSSCAYHPDVPASSKEANCLPTIFPDYCNVTVPCNIAPLNFMLPAGEYSECVARITTPDGKQQTYGAGVKVQIPDDEWHAMLNDAKGKSIKVEVWGKTTGAEHGNVKSEWLSFSPFEIFVAEEPIDEYLSYRLIEPSYVAWNFMEIAQRNITSFKETQIFNNKTTCIDREKGQCINCHSYQNYKTDNMLFHVRISNAGTVIVNDGKVSKVNLKRDYTISSGVYPAWHPTAKLIAFSTNLTGQLFHTQSIAKVEVQDKASALVLYDVERDTMYQLPHSPERFDNFPTWSPDGRRLYYTSALYVPRDTSVRIDRDMANHYQEVQYNLYYRDFDPDRLTFGEEHLLRDLQAEDQSASLPRVSPDGKSLIYASGKFGCFHVWHPDADIRLLHLDSLFAGRPDSLVLDKLLPLNSFRAESYPSWSSNGRWIVFSSRRDDGSFTRPYFTYFDKNGKSRKAFMLPQEDPEQNIMLFKSYNVPELTKDAVPFSYEQFKEAIYNQEGDTVTYKELRKF